MSNSEIADTLRHAADLLDAVGDHPHYHDIGVLIEAQRLVKDIIIPGVECWGVRCHYRGSFGQGANDHPRHWPYMAFGTKAKAEEWREFLAAYYDSPDRQWVVERLPVENVEYHTRDDDRPVGFNHSPSDARRGVVGWTAVHTSQIKGKKLHKQFGDGWVWTKTP
jgi:hypothetical protein